MNPKPFFATLAAAALLAGAATPAFATKEFDDDRSFATYMRMARMDSNKDGMVSKREFLDAMAKVWDTKAKEMKVRDDKFSEAQMREVLLYLRTGG